MIHGQLLGLELQSAVRAQTRADLFFPPRRFFQFTGDLALFLDPLRISVGRIQKIVFVVHKLKKRGLSDPSDNPRPLPSPLGKVSNGFEQFLGSGVELFPVGRRSRLIQTDDVAEQCILGTGRYDSGRIFHRSESGVGLCHTLAF